MHLVLGVNAIFYGTLALAVGAWTGNRTAASAVPAGVMVISYFATGLLPLVDPIAWLAKAFPWYYFSSSDPLVNGVHWGHLAVLSAGSVALGTAAFVGLNRRDLRSRTVGVSVLDRLRDNARTARVFESLAGSTRVSRIWIKTTSEHQALLFITASVMFGLMGPMHVAIREDIATLGETFPAATGRTRIAIYGTIGVALTSHLLNSFLPLSDNLAGWARITPHHYFLASDPLNNGMHWGHATLLAALTAALVAAAIWSFNRRDLRQG